MTSSFAPPAPLKTSVLFLVFNRPNTTAQVFEAIRQAKPPRLYVAADGPREGREGEADRVAKVREIATAVDWPCEVKTLFREKNMGCKYAVSGAITWFFEREEQGIILEDDCLPSQSFFWFCEDLLNTYKTDTRIMMIAGTNLSADPNSNTSFSFRTFAHVWGWATWRRAWERYDPEMLAYPKFKQEKILAKISNNPLMIKFWESEWDDNYFNKRNSWVNPFLFQILINRSMAIIPHINLVKNIGFRNDATHMKSVNALVDRSVAQEIDFPLRKPTYFIPDLGSQSFIIPNYKSLYFWLRWLLKHLSRHRSYWVTSKKTMK